MLSRVMTQVAHRARARDKQLSSSKRGQAAAALKAKAAAMAAAKDGITLPADNIPASPSAGSVRGLPRGLPSDEVAAEAEAMAQCMEKVWSSVSRTLFKEWLPVLRRAKEGRSASATKTKADVAAMQLADTVTHMLGQDLRIPDKLTGEKEGGQVRARSGSISDLKLDKPPADDKADVGDTGSEDGMGRMLAVGIAQSMLAQRLGGKQKSLALAHELTLRYQLRKAACSAAGIKNMDRLPAMKRWDAESLRPMRQVFLQEWQSLGGGVGHSAVPAGGGLSVKEENVLLIRVSSAAKADSDTDSSDDDINDKGVTSASSAKPQGDKGGVSGDGGRRARSPKGVWERIVYQEQRYHAEQQFARQQWREACTRHGIHKVGPFESDVRQGGPLSLDRAYELVLKAYCAHAVSHEEFSIGGKAGLLDKGQFRQFVFQQMFMQLGSNTLAHTQLRSLVLTVSRIGREEGGEEGDDSSAGAVQAKASLADDGRDENTQKISAGVAAASTALDSNDPLASAGAVDAASAEAAQSMHVWHGSQRSLLRTFGQFSGLEWDGLESMADDIDVMDSYCAIVAKAVTFLYDTGQPKPKPIPKPLPLPNQGQRSKPFVNEGPKWGEATRPEDAEGRFRASRQQQQRREADANARTCKTVTPKTTESHAERMREGGLYEQVEKQVGIGGYPLLVLGTAHRLAVEATQGMAMNMATGTGGSASRWARRAAAKAVKATTEKSFKVVRLIRGKLAKVEAADTKNSADGGTEEDGETQKTVKGKGKGKGKRKGRGNRGRRGREDDEDEGDIEVDEDGTRWRLLEEHTIVVGLEVLLEALLPEICRRKRMEIDYFRTIFNSFAAGKGTFEIGNGHEEDEDDSAAGAAAAAQGVAARGADERGDGSGQSKRFRNKKHASAKVGLDAFVPLVRATLVSCGGGDIRNYDEPRLREMVESGQLPTDAFCTSMFIAHTHGDDGIAMNSSIDEAGFIDTMLSRPLRQYVLSNSALIRSVDLTGFGGTEAQSHASNASTSTNASASRFKAQLLLSDGLRRAFNKHCTPDSTPGGAGAYLTKAQLGLLMAELGEPPSSQMIDATMLSLSNSSSNSSFNKLGPPAVGASGAGPSGKVGFQAFVDMWQERGLERCFRKYDADGSGSIGPQELLRLLLDLGVPPHEVAQQQGEIMSQYDANRNGSIDFCEFVDWWAGFDTLHAFRKYDEDGSGAIGFDEFKKLLADLKGDANFIRDLSPSGESDLKLAFLRLDADGTGEVEFDEFLPWWNRFKHSQSGRRGGGFSGGGGANPDVGSMAASSRSMNDRTQMQRLYSASSLQQQRENEKRTAATRALLARMAADFGVDEDELLLKYT
jgi:Ca2+-binding EF-hand superfamily protein